jgi:hypothetical protein
MLNRFARIQREFGTGPFAKTIFLLIALVALSIFGVLGFDTLWPAIVTVAGLLLGWPLRPVIVNNAELIVWAIPGSVVVYGVVLFLGERVLGISGEWQLLIITITTVLLFDAQFWSLSDPDIVNPDRD